MNEPPAALIAALEAQPLAPVSQDKLDRAREKLRQARDGEREIADTEERLKYQKEHLRAIVFDELPALFHEARIFQLGLDAEGNLPAYDCELKPYVHANIAAEWPPEKRYAAFEAVEKAGAADIIRSVITISFGKGENDEATLLKSMLDAAGVQYSESLNIHWSTLTAWLKDGIRNNHTLPPLDVIGATVGEKVHLKPIKA